MNDFYANLDSVIEDPRPVEQKERDYKTSNIVPSGLIIEWKEKPESEWRTFTPREQSSSLSCMGQAGAKAFEIIKDKQVYSAHPPYRSRSNFPQGGMWTQDLGNVFKNIGTNLESVDVSQNIGESQMNRDITCATPFKIGGYGFPDNCKNIDDIAEAIEKYGHCILIIHANKMEYTKPIPEYQGYEIDFGHGICATDYFVYNGERVIKIEDSTGRSTTLDKKGTRLITEDFLKNCCSSAIYFLAEPPKYIFKTFMKKGFVSNEVKELQKRLNKELGLSLSVDGKFGRKTEQAVKNYQKSKGLVSDGLVGSKTRAKLNE